MTIIFQLILNLKKVSKADLNLYLKLSKIILYLYKYKFNAK